MNRSIIGMVGVAMLAAFSGCSGQDGEEWSDVEVGQVEQAIGTAWAARDNLNNPTGGPGSTPLDSPRYGVATCVIRENNVDKMIVAGGVDAGGNVLSDSYKYDPSVDPSTGNQWTKLNDLQAGRAFAQAIQVPGDSSKCLIAGGVGTDEATELSSAEILSGSTWATTGAMNEPRSFFKLIRCGTSKLIAVGGRNASNQPTDEIDVFSVNAWTQLDTSASAGTQGLATARYSYGMSALDETFDQFLIAGGTDANGDPLASMELLSVDSSCANPTRVNTDDPIGIALTELEVMPASSSSFLVLGGTTSVIDVDIPDQFASLWGKDATTTTKLVNAINFGTGAVTVANNGSVLQSARSSFKVVALDATLDDFIIIGGRGKDASNPIQDVAVATSQIWDESDARFENASGTANAQDTLLNGRYFFGSEFLPSASEVPLSVGLVDPTDVGGEADPTPTALTERL